MGKQEFGYGYVVTGADGVVCRAVALHADQTIEILVKTRNVPGGTERYFGPAGQLWMWCNKHGIEHRVYSLVAAPNVELTGSALLRSPG